jgi:hypothetical protein
MYNLCHFSSELESKIDLMDAPEVVAKKLSSVTFHKSGILAFFEHVVDPMLQQFGISIKESLEGDTVSEHSFKEILGECISWVLSQVQAGCKGEEMEEIIRRAYPDGEMEVGLVTCG